MGANLKKFVNPKFTRTVDLILFKRLFERYAGRLKGFDLGVLEGESDAARKALSEFFAGPEENYPEGLIADLHRIAELGSREGLRLLQEQARRREIHIGSEDGRDDPKHVALRVFLDHPQLFDAAFEIHALEARRSIGEFAGAAEGVEASINGETRAAFEQKAKSLFEADLRGRYCRIDWHEDGDELHVIVGHAAHVTTTPVVKNEREQVISYRAAEHGVLAYSALTGRLKIAGIAKAHRSEIAEIFAQTMLGRPGFFAAPDSQTLYTLGPIEQAGFGFRFTHAFDPGIRRVQIVEVQADRISADPLTGDTKTRSAIVLRDPGGDALGLLGESAPRIYFRPNAYRIGHLTIRVHFDVGEPKPVRVTVKIKPPGSVIFKRHRFEARIMELLRRNGLCHEREPGQAALAAE